MSTRNESVTKSNDQYSLSKILGIWAVVSLPLALLTRVVVPMVAPLTSINPGILFWISMIIGMAWQYVVSMWIVYREEGNIRWSTLKQRFWLNKPRDPRTGELKAKLFWLVIPALLLTNLLDFGLSEFINAPIRWLFPTLSTPPFSDITALATPEFVGAWWLLGLLIPSLLFNYLLGEEFLFRGVLLPKMEGVFGKWDWVANAVLFGLYHIHWAPNMLSLILIALPGIWLSKRYRCNWFYITIHAFEGIFVVFGVFAAILGLI